MIRVLSIIGTRPEAIKMAPVVKELEKHPLEVRSIVCASGQHREMLHQALGLFDIRPDYSLDVMQPDQTLSGLTATLFAALDPVVAETRPDWILAQGDTTTVAVAAWVAYYSRVQFGHVEAGLRTGDRYRPFPEEMNRRIADSLSDLLFAPTEHSRQNLLAEGYPSDRITVTGNTVVDALLAIERQPFDWRNSPLAQLPCDKSLVLITAHRRESFGRPFHELCLAIRELAQGSVAQEIHFVYPVHLNPNVRQPVQTLLRGLPNLTLLEPLDYRAMVHLMRRSILILTDSGGIQEEAPSLGVPVLVMRENTERPEGVEAGVVRLIGTERARILQEVRELLDNPQARMAMCRNTNPYGDGQAAKRIVSALLTADG